MELESLPTADDVRTNDEVAQPAKDIAQASGMSANEEKRPNWYRATTLTMTTNRKSHPVSTFT